MQRRVARIAQSPGYMRSVSVIAVAIATFTGCASDQLVADETDVVAPLPGSKADGACEWSPEVVDEEIGRSRGQHSTLRIDAEGFAHIVYEDDDVNDQYDLATIRYATNRTGEWVTSTASTSCRLLAAEYDYLPLGTSANNTFDLDTDGHAFIACSDGNEVRLLDNASGAWRESIVRTPNDEFLECRATESVPEASSACHFTWSLGRHVALRVDSHGAPHVAYTVWREKQFAGSEEWTEYATREGNSWRSQAVAGGNGYIDLELDRNDRAHIVARIAGDILSGNVLGYTTNASGTWRSTTLQSAYRGDMGAFASCAVSKAGKLHAVHYNNTFYDDQGYTAALTYVRKGNGQPMSSEIRRGGTASAWQADIAVSSDDNVHFAFHDQGSLVYQVLEGDQLHPAVTVDGGGVGRHASLAIGGGTLHIAYFDDGEARLKYAKWTCAQ
jgi:hypothetical protein